MRLIDADAAKRRIIEVTAKVLSELNVRTFAIAAGMAEMFDCEDDFPTVGAELVKHGEWKKIQNFAKCSECMHEVNWGSKDFLSPYCPNCGAKMDGGETNEQRMQRA